MKNNSLLMPLFKTIDKILFGLDDSSDLETPSEAVHDSSGKEDESDVVVKPKFGS